MAFDFDQALASTDFRKAFATAPKPQDAGVFRDIADTGLQLAQGVLQGGNMLASTFGADNAAAQAFKSGAEWLASNFSDELKWKQLTAAQDMRAAELSGSTWEEIKAGARAIGADPVGFLANAAGTTIPTIAAAFLPGGQGALLGRLAATSMVGAAQGAGSVKSQIYDTVEEAWKKQGASDEEAQARAAAAQEYLGSNAGQIAIGTALGALAGGSGVEAGVVGRRLLGGAAQDAAQAVAVPTNSLVARALARTPRFIKEGAKEALPEGLQGGQEQVAGNIALQNEGFDRETFAGSAGAFTMEALAGAGVGAAVSPLTSSARQVRQAEEEFKRRDAEDRLAKSQSVDEMVKAANDLAMAPLDVPQFDEGRALDRLDALRAQDADDPVQAPEATATLVDAPFGDRIITLREQLADPDVRAAIREQFGVDGLNNATYYAGVADKVGPDTLPEKTRDNLLSVAEQMVRAAILKPIGTRPLTDQRPPGALALPAPSDEGGGGPRSIGLDTAPTGRFRVDAEGNAAPETRADVVSARDRERQRQAQREGLSGITPRGAAPQTSPLVEQQRAARRRTEGQPLDGLGQADPVLSYVESLRQVNTPAARAFVSEFQAGRITRRDIIEVMQSQPADPLGSFSTQGVPTDNASERLRRARDEGRARRQENQAAEVQPLQPAPAADPGGIVVAQGLRARPRTVDTTPEVMESDLTTGDGMPYGTKSGASVRARREGLGPENVVEIPGAGWVVRPAEPNAAEVQPMEDQSEPVGDMATTPALPAAAGTGRAPDAGRGGVAVGRVADDPGRGVQGTAEAPVAGGAEAAPAGGGGGADAALRARAIDAFKRVQQAKRPNQDAATVEQSAERAADRLLPAIQAKSADTLIGMNLGSADMNPASRAVFEAITGVKLPKGRAASERAIDEWAGVTPEQRAAKDAASIASADAESARQATERAKRSAQIVTVKNADGSTIDGAAYVDELRAKGFTNIVRRGPKTYLANAEGTGWPMPHKDIAEYARRVFAAADTAAAGQPAAEPADATAEVGSEAASAGGAGDALSIPVFADYASARAWVDNKAKKYGTKQAFTASEEYRKAYPQISALYNAEKTASNAKRVQAMTDAGVKVGDTVSTFVHSGFLGGETRTGKIVMRGGVPTVQLSGEMAVSRNGRITYVKSLPWDKRWSKQATTEAGQPAAVSGTAAAPTPAAPIDTSPGNVEAEAGNQPGATEPAAPSQPAPDNSAQATPQATAPTPSPAQAQEPAPPKAYPELEGKTIEQELEVEGHKVVRRRDAAKAMRALDEREASLRSLLDCLRGGG